MRIHDICINTFRKAYTMQFLDKITISSKKMDFLNMTVKVYFGYTLNGFSF